MEKTHNRIDEFVAQNSFRLNRVVPGINRDNSGSGIEDTSLNAFRPSEKKRALKGSREKEPGNLNKQIAIIKEQNYD